MSDDYDALFMNNKELTNKNSIKTTMLLQPDSHQYNVMVIEEATVQRKTT